MENNTTFQTEESLGKFNLIDFANDIIEKRSRDIIPKGLSTGKLIGKNVGDDIIDWLLNVIVSRLLKSFYNEVELIKVTYQSTDPTCKQSCNLSGLIIIPKSQNIQIRVPIIGYQHATQIVRKLAPSCFNKNKPLDFMEVIIGMLYASEYGSVVAMCDYQGMGDDDAHDHPYVNGNPIAKAAADLILTTKNSLNKYNIIWNNKLYLVGYSEGGYATMATTKEIIENPKYSDFKITQVAPMAGPHSLSYVMRNLMTRTEEYGDGYFLPMTMRGFLSAYGSSYGNGIFTKEKAVKNEFYNVWDMADGYHSAEEVNAAMPKVPRDILTDEMLNQLSSNDLPAFQALFQNDRDNWKLNNVIDLRFYHGENDDRVPFQNSVIAKNNFSKQGFSFPIVPMFHLPFLKSIHLGAAMPCLLSAYYWFSVDINNHNDTLLAGERLEKGNQLVSRNQKYSLRFQWDGSIAIYNLNDGTLVSMLNGVNEDAALCIFQTDGNFVLYNKDGEVIWKLNSSCPGINSKLTIGDDGHLSFTKS